MKKIILQKVMALSLLALTLMLGFTATAAVSTQENFRLTVINNTGTTLSLNSQGNTTEIKAESTSQIKVNRDTVYEFKYISKSGWPQGLGSFKKDSHEHFSITPVTSAAMKVDIAMDADGHPGTTSNYKKNISGICEEDTSGVTCILDQDQKPVKDFKITFTSTSK